MDRELLSKICYDIKNGTSHSVDYLMGNDVEKTLSKKGIKIRKIFSPFLRMIYKTQTKYKLYREPMTNKKGKCGKIFIMNHRQADDIVLGANAINEHAYIVFGNEKLVLETTNGIGLWANGMIALKRNDLKSRKATYEKMKYVLLNGGNILIYSEGYWNLDDDGISDGIHGSDCHNSECWLIQDLNIGALRLAKEIGCPIVPTILHYDEIGSKKCFSKRGEKFYIGKNDDIFKKKDELLTIMCTMKYELMEKYSSYNRSELEKNGISLKEQWIKLKEELIRDCDIPKVDYELDLLDEKRIGKAKVSNPVTSNEEAFSHLDNLEINENNAFLLSKRLSGRK